MKIKMFCRCSLFPSWSGKGLISTSGTLCGQNVELLNVKLAVGIETIRLYRVKSLL